MRPFRTGGQLLLLTAVRHSADAPGILEVIVDVRSRHVLNRVFAQHRFDAVIHAAGIASVDYSEQHSEESRESNLVGTRNVAELCAAYGARLVYVSTNAVFDGLNAPYRESDPVNPVHEYGRIKLACERLVEETVERFTIARLILMYGWPHVRGRPNPVTWVIGALGCGETVHVVDDVYENPIHNACAASAIWAALEREHWRDYSCGRARLDQPI